MTIIMILCLFISNNNNNDNKLAGEERAALGAATSPPSTEPISADFGENPRSRDIIITVMYDTYYTY